jgi:hypothetical protein
MDESTASERRSRSLYRSGAEQIIENSSLRDGLDQSEAQQLVDWATVQAKTAAYATTDFDDDEEAADYVDQHVRTVTRLMRLITLLVTQRHYFEAEDLAALLAELAQKRTDIYGETAPVSAPPFTANDLHQMASNQEAFSHLFHYLTNPHLLDEEE